MSVVCEGIRGCATRNGGVGVGVVGVEVAVRVGLLGIGVGLVVTFGAWVAFGSTLMRDGARRTE